MIHRGFAEHEPLLLFKNVLGEERHWVLALLPRCVVRVEVAQRALARARAVAPLAAAQALDVLYGLAERLEVDLLVLRELLDRRVPQLREALDLLLERRARPRARAGLALEA